MFLITNDESFSTEITGNYSSIAGVNITVNSTGIECNGSSYEEIFLFTFTAPATSLVMSLFSFTGFCHAIILQSIFLMLYTIWNNHLTLIFTSTCCIALATLCFNIINSRRLPLRKFDEKNERKCIKKIYATSNILETRLTYNGQIPFLTDYRGCLFILTAIAILGVDFKIFPSRFAKTSSYGWSLMDCGVGSFIVAHGICSSQAKGNYSNSVKRSIMSSLPLILLGFMRLTALTLVDYHESISEYGVHWNFFFTLAVTKIISSLLLLMFSSYLNGGTIAVCVIIIHQWLLSSFGVADLILSKSRDNLFLKNKEGICSLLGFVAIYLAGVELGRSFWKPRCKLKDWLRLFALLLVIGCVGLIVMLILHKHLQPTSRRMANITYCVWIICATSLQIAAHLLEHLILAAIQYFKFNESDFKHCPAVTLHTLLLPKAINYNGLFYFLLTNVLTGLVNLSIDTDKTPSFQAYCILASYTYVSSLIVIVMMKFSLQFKFW